MANGSDHWGQALEALDTRFGPDLASAVDDAPTAANREAQTGLVAQIHEVIEEVRAARADARRLAQLRR